MKTVIVDTNILHQEGLYSRNMQLLGRLALFGYVEICVPEIVKREFISKRFLDSSEKLRYARNSLASILKKVNKETEFHLEIVNSQKGIRSIESNLESQINQDFDNWVRTSKVVILPFEESCMKNVLDEYFSGGGVYRKPKHREDIPDAMIFSSIQSLLDERGEIEVIVKDGAFRKHLDTFEKINTYSELAGFLDLDENQNNLKQLDKISEKVESIKSFLATDEFVESLHKTLSVRKDDIEEIYLEDAQIQNKDFLEIDSFGENLNYPSPEDITDLKVTSVDRLSDFVYSIEVEFITSARLNYCSTYSDYMYLEENTYRDVSLDSMNGDGMCDLSEILMFKLSGNIDLTVTDKMSLDELKAHSKYLGNSDCEITIEINMNSAEIVENA